MVRGSLQRVGSFGLGAVFTAVAAILLLRHLGVEDFGRYATVMAVVAIVAGVSDAGLTVVGNRELALLPPGPERRRLLGELLGLRLLLTPLGTALGVLFALGAGYGTTLVVGVALAGAGLVLTNVSAVLLTLPAVELRNVRVSVAEVFKQAVMLVAIAALVVTGGELLGFFAVHIVVGASLVLATPLLVGRSGLARPRMNRERWGRLIRKGLPVAAAYALALVYFRVLLLILSLSSDETETGVFGTSLRVFELIVGVPTLAIGVALPVLTAAAADPERFRYQVDRLTRAALALSVFTTIVLALGARPAIAIIGGDEYAAAGGVLQVHILAFVPVFLGAVASTALVARGAQRLLVRANGAALIAMLVLGALIVPDHGAPGAAIAAVVGECVLALALFAGLRSDAPDAMPSLRAVLPVLPAAALGGAVGLVGGLPDAIAAALGGAVFLAVALVTRAIPEEGFQALRRGGGQAA